MPRPTVSVTLSAAIAAALLATACEPTKPTTPTTTTKPAAPAPTFVPTRVVAPQVGTAPAATITPISVSTQTAPATLSWAQPVTGSNIATSSPVVVDNGGAPFVVVGDLGGNLRAFDLSSGAARPGWSGTSTGFPVRAPLSSDGINVYVPLGHTGHNALPQMVKVNANGATVWRTNAAAGAMPSGNFLLAGATLQRTSSGAWQSFVASSGHHFYGIDGNGKQRWAFRNADSTMATIGLADLYGTGAPQLVVSNDRGIPSGTNGLAGGHLRIVTPNGSQICTAAQPARGTAHQSDGYNNSSPAIAQIGGQPLIVFGSTGPVQYGDGANQIVAYDNSCDLKWASAPLGGHADTSPSFADVLGTGTPQVITAIEAFNGSVYYPRLHVLDAATGRSLWDSGTSLATYGSANVRLPHSVQLVTADVDADGYQDVFVPGKSLLVISGRTRQIIADLSLAGAIQNTPVITAEPTGGVRVTFAGYSGNNGSGSKGGMVRSYVFSNGTLGDRGWTSFGSSAQLDGRLGELTGRPYDQLLESSELRSGESLRSPNQRTRLSMQSDGNLVLLFDGKVRWSSRTAAAGARLRLNSTGALEVRSPQNKVLWSSAKTSDGVSRLEVTDTGKLNVISAIVDPNDVHKLAATAVIWTV